MISASPFWKPNAPPSVPSVVSHSPFGDRARFWSRKLLRGPLFWAEKLTMIGRVDSKHPQFRDVFPIFPIRPSPGPSPSASLSRPAIVSQTTGVFGGKWSRQDLPKLNLLGPKILLSHCFGTAVEGAVATNASLSLPCDSRAGHWFPIHPSMSPPHEGMTLAPSGGSAVLLAVFEFFWSKFARVAGSSMGLTSVFAKGPMLNGFRLLCRVIASRRASRT